MVDHAALKKKAYELRKEVLRMVYRTGAGHVGGDLSEMDLLTVLFFGTMDIRPEDPKWKGRDRYVQSKGHCVEGYLCALADLGFFPKEELETFSAYGSKYIGHPNNKIPGVEVNSGALGHGLSIGVGMALGAKMNGMGYHTYVLMGDGEQAEGSVWEAAMAASSYKLDNLTAILDRNHLQITGATEKVMALEPLKEKWEAFGFHVTEIDGHDYGQIFDALHFRKKDQPVLVLANTVKGKGVSFMENQAKWHHGVLNEQQYIQAIRELEVKINGEE